MVRQVDGVLGPPVKHSSVRDNGSASTAAMRSGGESFVYCFSGVRGYLQIGA